ncbi:MAG: undecaprenyl-diphosphatase UppP [Candidatus Omnitrophica bacterium]|nr:undecaprenyl-diphosphatase UppP [Candidatus Omnitrophota bacterium]MDD5553725.1 undecaprenyl-diphosphatase UppP [Candidatus Omnitrophota bacterium]
MDLISTVILGIVEGVTEFLPISSTGHLILASSLLKIPQSEFVKTFEIAIQLGAICSVIALYWRSLVLDAQAIKRVLTAFIPTAAAGLIFYKLIKSFLGSRDIVLWSLFIGGIVIVIFELWYKRRAENNAQTAITYKQAFLIGVFQSFAMVPGVSRAAATIIGGLLLGINRKAIVEFSFLLAVPTMAAATALDLLKTAGSFTGGQFGLLIIGFMVSFVTAMLAIKFLLSFIKKNSFILFGVYRVALVLLFPYVA